MASDELSRTDWRAGRERLGGSQNQGLQGEKKWPYTQIAAMIATVARNLG